MNPRKLEPLNLGSDVIRFLLPHRSPLLMVDRITAYACDPQPRLEAQRYISANEPVFAGHFPDLKIWPGVYTQEGLGQSCNLATVLWAIEQKCALRGVDSKELLSRLRNLELGFRLQPGFQPELLREVVEHVPHPTALMGFAVAVDIKFLAPVFAGQRLDFLVERTHDLGDMVRYSVEAAVEARPVARGTMTGKVGIPVPVPVS